MSAPKDGMLDMSTNSLRVHAFVRPALARALALCALAFTLGSCRGLPFPEPTLDGPYGQALRRETRTGAQYSHLETRAFVRMVRLTPELVDLAAAMVAERRGEGPALAKARRDAWIAELDAPTFIAVVHTPEASWNDWDSAKSVWTIVMVDGETQAKPEKVTRLEKPFTPEQQALYPYLDDFAQGYRIRFPPGTKGQRIQAAGVLGKLDFDWSVPE